jgi:hypothetical protein
MHVVTDEATELVLGIDVGAGNGSDGDAAAGLVREIRDQIGLDVDELVGDMAYGDGDTRAEVEQAGASMVAKVPPAPNGDLFPKTAFTLDLTNSDAPTATCPAGHTTGTLAANGADQKGRPIRHLVFPAQLCAARLPAAPALRSRPRRSHHSVAASRDPIAGRPSRATPPRDKRKLRNRAKIERKIDHLQDLGMRKARYRGRRKTLLQARLAAIVADLSRIDLLGGLAIPARHPAAA